MRNVAVVMFALFALVGCTSFHDRLFFIEEAHIGLKVKASPEMSAPVDIDFGYRRSVMALVPGIKADAAKQAEGSVPPQEPSDIGEPLSVLSSFTADVSWFSTTTIHTYFATGEAAKNAARSKGALEGVFYRKEANP